MIRPEPRRSSQSADEHLISHREPTVQKRLSAVVNGSVLQRATPRAVAEVLGLTYRADGHPVDRPVDLVGDGAGAVSSVHAALASD